MSGEQIRCLHYSTRVTYFPYKNIFMKLHKTLHFSRNSNTSPSKLPKTLDEPDLIDFANLIFDVRHRLTVAMSRFPLDGDLPVYPTAPPLESPIISTRTHTILKVMEATCIPRYDFSPNYLGDELGCVMTVATYTKVLGDTN